MDGRTPTGALLAFRPDPLSPKTKEGGGGAFPCPYGSELLHEILHPLWLQPSKRGLLTTTSVIRALLEMVQQLEEEITTMRVNKAKTPSPNPTPNAKGGMKRSPTLMIMPIAIKAIEPGREMLSESRGGSKEGFPWCLGGETVSIKSHRGKINK